MASDYKIYTEVELLQKLTAGDQEAYTEIYYRYSTVVFQSAYNILRDRYLAEDVVQEIFLSLWQRHSSLHIQSLGGYLKQSAWYVAVRKQKEHLNDAQFYSRLQMATEEFSKEDPVVYKEFRALLEKVIASLPADELAILQCSREQNMKYSEIADHFNIPVKKVERKISSSLKKIRIQLGKSLLTLITMIAHCF